MTLARSSIRRRIYGGFAVVLLLLCAELWVAKRGVEEVERLRAQIEERIDPPADAAAALERTVFQRALAVRNLVVTGESRFREQYGRGLDEANALVERLRRSELDAESRAAVDGIVHASRAHVAATDAFLALLDERAPAEALARAEPPLAAARDRLLGRARAFVAAQEVRQEVARARVAELQEDLAAALLATALLVALALGVTAFLTVRSLRRPALALVGAAESVQAGDYGPALALAVRRGPAGASGSEFGLIAGAFARMADGLRRREERLAAEARIGAALATSLDPAACAAAALREVSSYAGAALAGVYLAEGEALLRVAGDGAPETVARDGIVAVALATGRPARLAPIPADLPYAIAVGFGEVRPRSVLAVPLTARGARVGLLLLGSVGDLDEDAVSFAEQAGARLAVALQNALAHRRLGALASELREGNARLHAQNEELQAQGEEIQAQAEELEAQSVDIRRHNDALLAAKETLAEKAAALEEADRRKNEFLATLGHELRNPLAAVATAGHLLEARSGGGDVARQAAVIGRQVGHLRRLVDDLLDLSRINHGKIELRRERFDLRAALRQALDASADAAAARSLHFSSLVGDEAAVVDADPARVEQVLSNVLQNAVKFTPPGGRVAVALAVEEGAAVVRVVDTGAGIPVDLLPRVFEPFVQGMHSEGEKVGLGLGLALVRRLVELHGGAVQVRSDGEGRGTELELRLPLAEGAAAAEPTAPAPRRAEGDMRLRVLVVEDNPDVADTTADALELFGYAVRVARDADAGLRACLEEAPDVALLDIGLPGRSGHELARDIRARLGDAVRLVAVTGYGQESDRAASAEAGFDAHLVKPVELDELRAVIDRLAFQGSVGAAA